MITNGKTKEQSSGSPILNINNKVIGIHIKVDINIFLNYPIKKFILENAYNNNINNKIILLDKDNTKKLPFL